MKKVLISILIVLLVVLAYFAIFNGLSFGNARILSIGEIIEANDELITSIEQAQSLLKKDYPSKKEELSTSITELLNKKEEYFNLAKVSTDKEITKANTEEIYWIEYLWTRVGGHATSKGVNLRMDINAGDTGEADVKNLSFTVTGQYIGIMDFVSALENDDELNFKIENFKMVQDGEVLSATFTVRGIKIRQEITSSSETSTQEQQNNNENITNENTQTNESKFNQLTGAVDNTLAPAENNT